MGRLALAFLLLLGTAVSLSAQTLSTRDILALTKAGLGEEVLLALIEVHRPVFPIDPATLKMLKDAGVQQRVIVAMVKSGRGVPPVELGPEPEPVITRSAPLQVVVVEHDYPREERWVREVIVPVAVPIYVPVRVHPRQHVPLMTPAEPVYWGFGGKLRPDAWKPSDPPQKK